VSDTLNPANSTNTYRFAAAAGQSFYFAPLSVSGNNWWSLIDPYGNQLFSTFFNNDVGQRRLTVNAAGSYTLLVEGDLFHTGTFSYSLNVVPVADTTQPLTLGSAVNAALAAPGQQDRYTFTVPAKALMYFDSLTNSSQLHWSL